VSQIVQQPDGLFAVYDGVVGHIVCWNASADEIVEFFRAAAERDAQRLIDRVMRDTREHLDHVAAGKPRHAYAQFALTWEQVLQKDRTHDGEASRWFASGGRDPDV